MFRSVRASKTISFSVGGRGRDTLQGTLDVPYIWLKVLSPIWVRYQWLCEIGKLKYVGSIFLLTLKAPKQISLLCIYVLCMYFLSLVIGEWTHFCLTCFGEYFFHLNQETIMTIVSGLCSCYISPNPLSREWFLLFTHSHLFSELHDLTHPLIAPPNCP